MSKSNAAETQMLSHYFNNASVIDIGDAGGLRGSVAAGSFFLSLHTADPGEAGTQATSEISYTGYARVAVARSSAGFTVTGSQVTLTTNQDFGKMTAGTGGVVTFFAVGKVGTGATEVLYKGAVTPTITVATGVIPRLETGTNINED